MVEVPAAATPLVAALAADARAALRSGPLRIFALIVAGAAVFGSAIRGPGHLVGVAVILALCGGLGLVAWWCGRHPRAHPSPDVVRSPKLESLTVVIAFGGVMLYVLGVAGVGVALVVGSAAAALVVLARAGYGRADLAPLWRTWLPFVPLLVAIGAPKLYAVGPILVAGLPAGLASGIVQQLVVQLGVTARLEALWGRRDVAAVGSALLFALPHMTFNLPQAGGYWALALANALVFQFPIGLVAAFAYQRHRAPVALGAVHGLAIA